MHFFFLNSARIGHCAVESLFSEATQRESMVCLGHIRVLHIFRYGSVAYSINIENRTNFAEAYENAGVIAVIRKTEYDAWVILFVKKATNGDGFKSAYSFKAIVGCENAWNLVN